MIDISYEVVKLPFSSANWRGVLLSLSLISTFAPNSIRARTTLQLAKTSKINKWSCGLKHFGRKCADYLPWEAARCSGVCLSLSSASIVAPNSIRVRTTSSYPEMEKILLNFYLLSRKMIHFSINDSHYFG